LIDSLPTAAVAAGGLIAGFGVADASGSRPLGGAVLLASGVICGMTWLRRHGWPTALALAGADLAAFAGSHGLAKLIGAWPAVLTVAAAMGALAWRVSDARAR
jgi:hypothetical protein